jgi:hypothetical protein
MEIKELISRIGKLQNREKLHILNILKANDVDFTKNTNGYFFNLANIQYDILIKIVECLELIENNRNIMIEMDKRRSEMVNYYKKIIQERIENKVKQQKDDYINRLMIRKREGDLNVSLNIRRKMIKTKSNVDEKETEIKVDKNTVWYRILSRIKQYNQRHNAKQRVIKSQMNYDDIQEIYDGDIDVVMFEDDDVYEEDEIGAEYEDIQDKNSVTEDDESVVDHINSEDEDDIEDNNISDDKTEIDIQYYKNLLNKQGFVFDDNKRCNLAYQEYIKLEDVSSE